MDKHTPQWPCIGKEGLKVFATTADQRYLLSPEVFLRTHYPITMRKFLPNRPSTTVSEDDLLATILATSATRPGNRVFVLYGAAGSGKSELMRWLETRVGQEIPERAAVTVRIARTELDIMHIAERFKHILSQTYFDQATHRRWEAARRKPRTLAKLLVLTALERTLGSDEDINALYYRLLNMVQPNIERSLAAMDDLEQGNGPSIEFLTREDLAQIKEETVLDVPLEYETFRHTLLTVFREHLLEGMILPTTLQLISEDLTQRGLRPILLIDDLVQSLNLFATNLLDYFITLEQGNWDVVIGLTPASFEFSERGRELLNRIAHLDTIDDRVEKLWLSDQRGHDSYFLNESNCHEFAWRYLDEYRRQNGMLCSKCTQFALCKGLHKGGGDQFLTPLNHAATIRLFRALPDGKGKARYLVKRLRGLLIAMSNGQDVLERLALISRTEAVAQCADEKLACLCEIYGSLITDQRQVTLPAGVLVTFGYPAEPRTVTVESLLRRNTQTFMSPGTVLTWEDDPDKQAIRDWLDGKPVNRQSLRKLRQGTARWLRAVYPPDILCAEGIARPHGVLRWRRTFLDVRPPILLEGVDQEEGILLQRAIGHTAFRLAEYAKATGDNAATLARELAQDERLLPLLFAAMQYRQRGIVLLETQLGVPIDELTVALYVLTLTIEGITEELHPGLSKALLAQIDTRHKQLAWEHLSFDHTLSTSTRKLFDDFFKLRENVYDGPRVARLLADRTLENMLTLLTEIPAKRIDKDYRLNRERLSEELEKASSLAEWLLARRSSSETKLAPAGQSLWVRLQDAGKRGVSLSEITTETLTELQSKRPGQYKTLRIFTQMDSTDAE